MDPVMVVPNWIIPDPDLHDRVRGAAFGQLPLDMAGLRARISEQQEEAPMEEPGLSVYSNSTFSYGSGHYVARTKRMQEAWDWEVPFRWDHALFWDPYPPYSHLNEVPIF